MGPPTFDHDRVQVGAEDMAYAEDGGKAAQLAAVEASFQAAQQPPVHRTKPRMRALEVLERECGGWVGRRGERVNGGGGAESGWRRAYKQPESHVSLNGPPAARSGPLFPVPIAVQCCLMLSTGGRSCCWRSSTRIPQTRWRSWPACPTHWSADARCVEGQVRGHSH